MPKTNSHSARSDLVVDSLLVASGVVGMAAAGLSLRRAQLILSRQRRANVQGRQWCSGRSSSPLTAHRGYAGPWSPVHSRSMGVPGRGSAHGCARLVHFACAPFFGPVWTGMEWAQSSLAPRLHKYKEDRGYNGGCSAPRRLAVSKRFSHFSRRTLVCWVACGSLVPPLLADCLRSPRATLQGTFRETEFTPWRQLDVSRKLWRSFPNIHFGFAYSHSHLRPATSIHDISSARYSHEMYITISRALETLNSPNCLRSKCFQACIAKMVAAYIVDLLHLHPKAGL